MAFVPSSRWPDITLDLENVSLKLSSPDEALRLAHESESGILGATGEAGDCVELQFDGAHGMVLYMTAEQKLLRPHFPHRQESGDGIEEFFCACCGVQLGDKAEMLSRCMARKEALRLCREILRGRLPDAVPDSLPEQLYLTGMEALSEDEALWRIIQWCRLQPRRSSSPGGSGGPPSSPHPIITAT